MFPAFDVRTLFFVGAVASFVCGAMLWHGRRLHAPSGDALVWSAAAQMAFGTAMLLLAMRGRAPDLLTYPVANALGSWAAALVYEGVRRVAGARPMPWLAIGTLGALLGVHAVIGTGNEWFELRLQLTSAVQGGFALASLPLLVARLRGHEEPAAPMRWAIAFLSAFAAGHALRFVVVGTHGAHVGPDGLAVGALQALMPTMFALAPMIYALILIGLVNGRLARELWALATVDTLTGVRNRRSFIDGARAAIAGSRDPVLMMLDLDRFKQINDRYGHAQGDRVLSSFARLLRDSFPQDAIVGRYGGEEFCLLLPDAPPGVAPLLAQRLCDTVRDTSFGLPGPDARVTVSIGVAARCDGSTLEELLIAADRRLYVAKATGRDRVVQSDCTLPPDPRPVREAEERSGNPVLAS